MLFYEFGLVFLFACFLAALASFFNVVIYRTAREETFIKGRSKCESCGKQLYWKDNIPLLSFPFLKGKCRYCGKKINRQHFLIEFISFASAWIFYALYLWLPAWQALPIALLIIYFLSLFILSFIIWSDLQHFLVPDFFVLLLTIFALFLLFQSGNSWFLPLLAVTFSIVFFSLLYLIAKKILKKEALGLGDLKLMIPLALLLSWPLILVNIFLAFIGGGIFAMIMIAIGQKKIGQSLPFAPFLVIAAIISYIWGEKLLQWYLKFLF